MITGMGRAIDLLEPAGAAATAQINADPVAQETRQAVSAHRG